YDLLVRALAPLAALDWRLSIIGATDRSPAALAALNHAVHETGLTARVTIAGPLGPAELGGHYDRAGLFVLPSLYEGYRIGVGRGQGPRPADRLPHGRGGRRGGAERGRPQGPPGRCGGPDGGAASHP